MKFTACKYLDYSDNYDAKKQVLGDHIVKKVFWLRKIYNEDDPDMVQFCKKRGRLNYHLACTSAFHAQCRDYITFEHEVDDSTISD